MFSSIRNPRVTKNIDGEVYWMLSATVSDLDTCVIEEEDTLDTKPEGVYLRKEETELTLLSSCVIQEGHLRACLGL